jgi:hypothetical protein
LTMIELWFITVHTKWTKYTMFIIPSGSMWWTSALWVMRTSTSASGVRTRRRVFQFRVLCLSPCLFDRVNFGSVKLRPCKFWLREYFSWIISHPQKKADSLDVPQDGVKLVKFVNSSTDLKKHILLNSNIFSLVCIK